MNGGGIDPLAEIIDVAHHHSAWVHVDGAFGLWASATPALETFARRRRAGRLLWATDAHKWLNVPYDSGLVFCAHPDQHRASMQVRADYLSHAESSVRDPLDYNPEFSRRARGFAIYAALRASAGVASSIWLNAAGPGRAFRRSSSAQRTAPSWSCRCR